MKPKGVRRSSEFTNVNKRIPQKLLIEFDLIVKYCCLVNNHHGLARVLLVSVCVEQFGEIRQHGNRFLFSCSLRYHDHFGKMLFDDSQLTKWCSSYAFVFFSWSMVCWVVTQRSSIHRYSKPTCVTRCNSGAASTSSSFSFLLCHRTWFTLELRSEREGGCCLGSSRWAWLFFSNCYGASGSSTDTTFM